LIDSLLYVDALQAFVKRLLQVCQLFTPPLICASLVLVSELVKLRPTLLRLSKLAQVHDYMTPSGATLADRAALISISAALSQTPAYTL